MKLEKISAESFKHKFIKEIKNIFVGKKNNSEKQKIIHNFEQNILFVS